MGVLKAAALSLLLTNLVVGVLLLQQLDAPGKQGIRVEGIERIGPLSARAAARNTSSLVGARLPISDGERLDTAIKRAAAFLRQQLHAGAYSSRSLAPDGSPRAGDKKGHVFVVSYVAEALQGLIDEIDRSIMLVRILSEQTEGKWAWELPEQPYIDAFRPLYADADDTAFATRTLRRLGVGRPPTGLLHFYREPERLFATFDTPGPIALTTQMSPQNHLLAHPEVNFNVFLALRRTNFEHLINKEAIRGAQDPRGFWPSYFYPSPLFATLLALDLLDGDPAFATETERALAYIAATQNADGSWGTPCDPYETSLAVASLAAHDRYAAATRRGVDSLLSVMEEDGSWSSPACIWRFVPVGGGDASCGLDEDRALTTARSLIALRRFAGQLGAGP